MGEACSYTNEYMTICLFVCLFVCLFISLFLYFFIYILKYLLINVYMLHIRNILRKFCYLMKKYTTKYGLHFHFVVFFVFLH